MVDRKQKHFYVMLFSNASQMLYPKNVISAFTAELAQPIILNSNYDWEVGLCEFSCVPPKAGIYQDHVVVGESNALIYCNIISPQFMGNNLVRCLRTFICPSQYCNFNFEQVYYVPVEKKTIKHIRI
jgi:hypothetical protein